MPEWLNIASWITCFNMLILIAFIPLKLYKKLRAYTLKNDGHWSGLVIMLVAGAYIAVTLALTVLDWNTPSIPPVLEGLIRPTAMMAILSGLIPYIIGREIYRGKKYFD